MYVRYYVFFPLRLISMYVRYYVFFPLPQNYLQNVNYSIYLYSLTK